MTRHRYNPDARTVIDHDRAFVLAATLIALDAVIGFFGFVWRGL